MELLTYTLPDTLAGFLAAILAGVACLKSRGLWSAIKTLLSTAQKTYQAIGTASSISGVFVNVSKNDWIIFCGYVYVRYQDGKLTDQEKIEICNTFLKMLAGEDISTVEVSTESVATGV
jgi:hypothetical protein